MINKERLYSHIQELGKIGKDKSGGITRFPYTKEDEEAKVYLVQLMKKAHLKVRIDAVGNIIGTRVGTSKDKIICGSHFDTVRNGGIFDGCLGILSAIEVLQIMEEEHLENVYTIEVIAFKNEEGNRFSTIMTGSRALCGSLCEQDLSSADEQGITLKEAAITMGYAIEEYLSCAYDFQHVKGYVELHIEQGNVLDQLQQAVGIVKGIAGIRRYILTIHGESGHSGAIPMEHRIDPVIAFSKIALFINQEILKYPDAVATIGEIHTYPGSCNVICDHLSFHLDVRSLSMNDILSFMRHVQQQFDILETTGFRVDVEETQVLPPSQCDEKIINIIQSAMKKQNLPMVSLMSGAGHDAMNFSGHCPIGMIFVRSIHGYSHRPEEFSSMEDCAIGANVYYQTLLDFSCEKG